MHKYHGIRHRSNNAALFHNASNSLSTALDIRYVKYWHTSSSMYLHDLSNFSPCLAEFILGNIKKKYLHLTWYHFSNRIRASIWNFADGRQRPSTTTLYWNRVLGFINTPGFLSKCVALIEMLLGQQDCDFRQCNNCRYFTGTYHIQAIISH